MMANDVNKFPAYDKDAKAKLLKDNHFPLLGIETQVVVNKDKRLSFANILHRKKLIAEIKAIHKNNYYDLPNISLDDNKFPYFYQSSQQNDKKFPFEQMINNNSKEASIKPQKICNKFPLKVDVLAEQHKFPLVGKMYDINLNENMPTIFMSEINKKTRQIPNSFGTTTNFNYIFDKQEFPLKLQLETYTLQFPLNYYINNNNNNNKFETNFNQKLKRKIVRKNSKDKFVTPLILYSTTTKTTTTEKKKKYKKERAQDQVENCENDENCENARNENQVHMPMNNNNEIQKFNEQQKIPKQQQQQQQAEEEEEECENIKKTAINKQNVEEKQVQQTIIMLEAFCENEQKNVVVDKSSLLSSSSSSSSQQQMMTTAIIPFALATTMGQIEHFENDRITKQIDENKKEGKSNNNNNSNNNINENLANIQDIQTIKSCYLINKQITTKNVLENFEFENVLEKDSSDVCEQSTQEVRCGITIDEEQLNIFKNISQGERDQHCNSKEEKEEDSINLIHNENNFNVMGLTNFGQEEGAISEQIEVEKEFQSSIDLGATTTTTTLTGNGEMKHDKLNVSNKNMPEQKQYDDLNKSSFTTYPRAKQATDYTRKLLDEKSIRTTTTTNEPTCSSIRKSSTSLDVASVLPERTLLRRQRRTLSQKSKSEQEEDPVERLNRLRARISGALCQVKGVLKQYSADNAEEPAQNTTELKNYSSNLKEETAQAKEEQEKSSETDNGPISFRFVRKIRRRSSFDERVVLEVPQKLNEEAEKEKPVEVARNEIKSEQKFEDSTSRAEEKENKEPLEELRNEVENGTNEAWNETKYKQSNDDLRNEANNEKSNDLRNEVEYETKASKTENEAENVTEMKQQLEVNETSNETTLETLENQAEIEIKFDENEQQNADTMKEQINDEFQTKNEKDIVLGTESDHTEVVKNESVSKENSENEAKKTDKKTKVKKRIFVVKTKPSSARRASVAAVEVSKIEEHAEHFTPMVSTIRVHRRPSDSEAIIAKKNNHLFNNNNKTNNTNNLNLGDTEKLLELEIGCETRGNETQLHVDDKKKLKKNTILQVHSKVKQKAHGTPLAKTNEHVAADIDIINNNNNNHNNKNVNLQHEQLTVEHKIQCATIDCNQKGNKTDHTTDDDNDMKLESNAIDIEREQQVKVTDNAQVLSATIATDAPACNSFEKSTEHLTTEISCAADIADIAMPELQSLPARVLLTSSADAVVPEDPPFNDLQLKDDKDNNNNNNNKRVILSTNSIQTVNAETQTPSLLQVTTVAAESNTESVKSKPRKVKKKVIIKRQQRRLSVSDTGFFREPVSEEGQANGAAVDVETLEKPIAYETDDECNNSESTQQSETAEGEPAAEPELSPEPLRSCLKAREFQVGDWVMYAERYKKTLVRWKKGLVIERITSISYKLDIDGKEVPAHISYIKKYTDRKVNFGGKEYLEINYEQIEEEEEQARRYSIWNLV